MALLRNFRNIVPRLAQNVKSKAVNRKSSRFSERLTSRPKREHLLTSVRGCQTISTKESSYPLDLDDSRDLEGLMDLYDTFLLDCDGVLWGIDHHTRFHNIRRSVEKLRACGKKLIFVTNNSMHSRDVYYHKFQDMCDFEADTSDVFSVNYAAALYLKSIAKVQGKVYALGSRGMSVELEKMGLEHYGFGTDPDAITDDRDSLLSQRLDPDVQAVLVGFDIHIGYNKIYKAASYLSDPSVFYVATNDIETRVPIGRDRIQPLTGVITEAVNAASGRRPVVVGKPYNHLMACVLSANPTIDLHRTVMIGDSIGTDVGFAYNSGIDSILVMSGSTSEEDLRHYYKSRELELPTYTLSSFNRFAEAL